MCIRLNCHLSEPHEAHSFIGLRQFFFQILFKKYGLYVRGPYSTAFELGLLASTFFGGVESPRKWPAPSPNVKVSATLRSDSDFDGFPVRVRRAVKEMSTRPRS